MPQGSHNQTVHPSGDYLYNSNSQLYTTALNAGIEVYDIRDFAIGLAPELFPGTEGTCFARAS